MFFIDVTETFADVVFLCLHEIGAPYCPLLTHVIGVVYRYQKSDLVKLDILLNGQSVDAMATIVHNLKAQRVGRELVDKLKKFIDRSVVKV